MCGDDAMKGSKSVNLGKGVTVFFLGGGEPFFLQLPLIIFFFFSNFIVRAALSEGWACICFSSLGLGVGACTCFPLSQTAAKRKEKRKLTLCVWFPLSQTAAAQLHSRPCPVGIWRACMHMYMRMYTYVYIHLYLSNECGTTPLAPLSCDE